MAPRANSRGASLFWLIVSATELGSLVAGTAWLWEQEWETSWSHFLHTSPHWYTSPRKATPKDSIAAPSSTLNQGPSVQINEPIERHCSLEPQQHHTHWILLGICLWVACRTSSGSYSWCCGNRVEGNASRKRSASSKASSYPVELGSRVGRLWFECPLQDLS